ncbi:peptidase family M28 [Ophiocordyceps camponoti-floridani]|uniref:Peptide hydrolase n=1 Tax=Ophiocordyceps camponoti-floridani TaxID=2030778 RepID=A0A8H4VF80_9HYPO|nr:peptidase family M28 [Ophiocordyceps camponoti-floridani]
MLLSRALLTTVAFWLGLRAGKPPLGDDDLRQVAGPDSDFESGLLNPIMIPRVAGTEGSARVQRHFVDFFSSNLPAWKLLWQNSTSKTPVTGDRDVPFANLIFRRDPPGASEGRFSRLTLVAHYDSKYTPEGFIGATDSAAPCAMLLHVARALDAAIGAKWASGNLKDEEGLQIILLDGEEAFLNWTDDDSLYGARALTAEWDTTLNPPLSTFRSQLDAISHMVLLDLLGSKDPNVPSYFSTTHWMYKMMSTIEKRMRALDLLESKPPKPFLPDDEAMMAGMGGISDDHIPFMRRGVNILHIIPSPFPAVWHTMADDGGHLDMATVRDWAKIVTAFVKQWMAI